jgi:hypothetical protein
MKLGHHDIFKCVFQCEGPEFESHPKAFRCTHIFLNGTYPGNMYCLEVVISFVPINFNIYLQFKSFTFNII